MTEAAGEAEHRRQLRAFVRAHHPDVGGDPAEFVAGLARLRGTHPATRCGSVSTRPPGRVDRPADDDPRLDVPVVLLADPVPVRAARVLARRLRRLLDDLRTSPIRID